MQLVAVALFIFAAGVGSSVQSIVNSELGRRTDPVSAAVVSFIGGLAVLLLVALLSGRLQLVEATKVPPLLFGVGGLMAGIFWITGRRMKLAMQEESASAKQVEEDETKA